MKLAPAVALALSIAACTAQAQDSPQWILRAGVHPVQPKPRNHAQLHIRDGVGITLSASYMASEHWGIEALAALPIDHEITLREGGKAADIRQLPPTLSLQYHFFDPNGRIRGHVGVGLNYTVFFDERTTGPLAGAELTLDSSLGPAAQLGLDFDLGRTWFVGVDARWFDIDTRSRLDGASLGTIEIDPYAIGLSIGRRFP